MLNFSDRALEKQAIKARKQYWYTHVVNKPSSPAPAKLINLAAAVITRMHASELESSLHTWILSEWTFNHDEKAHSPQPLGKAIAEIIISNNSTPSDSQFIRNAVERVADIISCIIIDNLVYKVTSHSFSVLNEIISALQANKTNDAKNINDILREKIVLDKEALCHIESTTAQTELDKALIALDQLYYDKKDELIRIKSKLPAPVSTKLFSYKQKNNFGERFYPTFRDDYKIMLAHALELKEIYQNSHYVFIHGQMLDYWVYLKFATFLCKKLFPGKDLSHFLLLKLHNNLFEKIAFDAFALKCNDENSESVRAKILSVDGYFFSTHRGESASYFCQSNINIWQNGLWIYLASFIEAYLKLSPEQYSPILKEVFLLAEEVSTLSETGNLIVVCIPKNNVADKVYEAHPFGTICCHDGRFHEERLKALQNDLNEPDSDSVCSLAKKKYNASVAQYRILTHKLDPDEGDRVHLLSPLSRYSRMYFKEQLRPLAERLHSKMK